MASKRKAGSSISKENQKKAKLNVSGYDPELPSYFDWLPPEILGEILKDSQIDQALVCSRFNDICASRLRLCLDFKRILKEGYPILTRSYTEIKMTGYEIDDRAGYWEECLINSQETLKKLSIASSRKEKMKLSMRTLLRILKFFPNIRELDLRGVNILEPPFKFSAIRGDEFQELPNLKKLTLKKFSANVFKALQEVKFLEELSIDRSNAQTPRFKRKISDFIRSQMSLKYLEADYQYMYLQAEKFPQLRSISVDISDMFSASDYWPVHAFFSLKFAPNLKSLVIKNTLHHLARWPFDSLPTLESIEVMDSTEIAKLFSEKGALSLYPSLIEFKSNTYNWKKSDAI